jgi:hypothetical protein
VPLPPPLPPEREGGIKSLTDLSPSLLGEGFRERQKIERTCFRLLREREKKWGE